ncbi:MAG: chemotaxis protein CheW [Brachymonas sp.]|nr:chemotaxis protein CheW [Brachymonas sp.]
MNEEKPALSLPAPARQRGGQLEVGATEKSANEERSASKHAQSARPSGAAFFGADLIEATVANAAIASVALASESETEPDSEAALNDDAPFALPAPTAAARTVSYARNKRVAFAPHATQELLENPQWMTVPGGAYYARGLLHWQNRHIPFIDLESLLLAYPAFDAQAPVPYAMVLAYQTAPHEPLQYGAIALTDIPHTQTVTDADFSPLPSDSDMWAELAISCFKQNGQVTPILDAAKIFSRYHG